MRSIKPMYEGIKVEMKIVTKDVVKSKIIKYMPIVLNQTLLKPLYIRK